MRPERMQISPRSSSRNLRPSSSRAYARIAGVPPLRGSVASCSLPRAYARGFLMPSLRDWGWSGARRVTCGWFRARTRLPILKRFSESQQVGHFHEQLAARFQHRVTEIQRNHSGLFSVTLCLCGEGI